MYNLYITYNLSELEPELAPTTITNTVSPDRARAIEQAAAEFGIEARRYDPDDPEQRDRYIQLVIDNERRVSVNKQPMHAVRTPEQVQRDVIDRARKTGRVLLALTPPGEGCLTKFWGRVDQIRN